MDSNCCFANFFGLFLLLQTFLVQLSRFSKRFLFSQLIQKRLSGKVCLFGLFNFGVSNNREATFDLRCKLRILKIVFEALTLSFAKLTSGLK